MINKAHLLTYLYLLIYILLSSGVILYNKWVLSPKYFNFPLPITLTMIHMGFSGVVAFFLVCVFKVVAPVKMTFEIYATCVIPISAFFASSLWEIQEALVDIGDKDPSFIGSREWIGAIDFVLDKLLGVSCKVINVRSGAELPEKCRQLALHFETQGTAVMIGGGVLAYTLLGVDYNKASRDCAFLILDPHYTGSDDFKKIVNGGWCGWKKAVDSKGKSFFLHDKFYNLLLPQRPNMI